MSDPIGVAVLDIDGVLADVSHRLPHLQRRPKDWAAFFAAMADDPVLEPGRELAHQLALDHPIVYLTGRPHRYAPVTQGWLDRHDLPHGHLIERRDGDRRPARIAKPAMLSELARHVPIHVVVDDDEAVCEAYRQAGYRVLRATWSPQPPTLYDAQEREGAT
jgi:hypothetical protein